MVVPAVTLALVTNDESSRLRAQLRDAAGNLGSIGRVVVGGAALAAFAIATFVILTMDAAASS